MSNHDQMHIGNQHFKIWLKNLDPVTRVKNMTDIAKTQRSAGLSASLIKSSLAQLSQSCQVKLVRLTEEEIKHYSRQSLLKYPVEPTATPENQMKNKHNKHRFSELLKNNVDMSTVSRDNNKKGKKNISSDNKMREERFISTKASPLKENITFKTNKSHPNLLSLKIQSNQNNKLKKRMQELFGDDNDNLTGIMDEVEDLASANGNCDKNIKSFHSTTVNVNIYNSSIHNKTGVDKSSVKRKSHTENSLLNSDDSLNKRLRIDVSLSNDKNCPPNNNIITVKSKQKMSDKSHKFKPKKKLAHRPPKENSATKSKAYPQKATKSSSILSNTNTNSPEEDPSIKELWSILGMESPTDRSESIIKSYPPLSVEDKITLLKAPIDNNSELSDHSLTKPSETLHINSCRNQSLVLSEKEVSKIHTSIEQGETNETTLNRENLTQETEPVCKISETFSLAEVPPEVHGLFTPNMSSPIKQTNINKNENVLRSIMKDDKQRSSFEQNSSVNETIQILDDGEYEDERYQNSQLSTNTKEQENENVEKCNKIGTIRVKSLGLLMKPQLLKESLNANGETVAATNDVPTPRNTQVNVGNVQRVQPDKQDSLCTKDNVEERFFLTYKFYFDEMVESKIAKLGELLHLAVSDGIRRKERIKRAEQLSSDDLIKEEKQRADKDFSDMMRIRGNEFSPLCELILKKFDQNSKITLFIALFCRMLIHAEQIDSLNKSQILEAKSVALAMLSKHQFKDKDVLNFLQSEPELYTLQFEAVRRFVEVYLNRNNKLKNNPQIEVHPTTSNRTPCTNAFRLPIVNNTPNIRNINKVEVARNASIRSGNVQVAPTPILPKGSLQGIGTHCTVPVRNTPASTGKTTSKSNRAFNNVFAHTSGVLKKGPGQISSTTSCPVTAVSLPQSPTFLVQPVGMGLKTQMANDVNYPPSTIKTQIPQPHLAMLPSATSQDNIEDPTFISTNFLPQTTINPPTPQRSIVVTAVPSQTTTMISNLTGQCGKTGRPILPQQQTHVVVSVLEPELSNVSTQRRNHCPIIIRSISRPSSPAIVGLDPSNGARSQAQLTAMISVTRNPLSPVVTSPAESLIASSEAITTVTNSRGIQPVPTHNVSSTVTPSDVVTNSALQTQVPSTSHCHPFVKRMPISGKMKMFFGHSSIKS